MTRDVVFEAIREILRDEVRCSAPITSDTDLHADAQLDSVDLLTLAVALENRFEIALDDPEQPEELRVGRLVDRVMRELGRAGSGPKASGRAHHE